MNNYSFYDRLLHRFALKNKFIRKMSYQIESDIIKVENNCINDHVFISGMARSGTTILLNNIYKSGEFASLTYSDMPFILAPNIWNKLNSYSNTKKIMPIERAHKDGLMIDYDSPEAFEEVFWMTFETSVKDNNKILKKYVDLILKKYQKNRYLSKNNQNIKRLPLIKKIFPNSIILISYREPYAHCRSLLDQHKKFIALQKKDKFYLEYMNYIGHSEFGSGYKQLHDKNTIFLDTNEVNHWLEQWYITYQKLLLLSEKINMQFICYEKLCNDSKSWDTLLDKLMINKKYSNNYRQSTSYENVSYNEDLLNKCKKLYIKLNKQGLEAEAGIEPA